MSRYHDLCPKWMKDDFADWFLREITAMGRWRLMYGDWPGRSPWAALWAAKALSR